MTDILAVAKKMKPDKKEVQEIMAGGILVVVKVLTHAHQISIGALEVKQVEILIKKGSQNEEENTMTATEAEQLIALALHQKHVGDQELLRLQVFQLGLEILQIQDLAMKIEVEEIHRLGIVIALVCETMSKCACKKSSDLGIQKRPHYKMQDPRKEEIVSTIQKGVVARLNTIAMAEDNFKK